MKASTIRKIFHPFSNNKFIRSTFGPIYKQYIYGPVRKREIANFQKNSLDVLKIFDQVLNENDIPYCLMWGSLIGAVREKGFIKHDFDIDIAMWISDYSDSFIIELKKAGFIHKHRFLVDDGKNGMEDTISKDGVDIDIFYIYKDYNNQSYCTSFDRVNGCVSWEESLKKFGYIHLSRFYFPFQKKFIYTRFENMELPIPENYDAILREYYGEYMLPNPSWNGAEIDKAHRWLNHKVDYIKFGR